MRNLLHTRALTRSLSKTLSCAILSASTLVLCAQAGGPPRVALLPADSSTNFNDAQAKLQATGRFSQVDVILVQSVTPTLAQLETYDAVLTWSNNNYANAVGLGDVLADYVDAGGGVVVSLHASTSTNVARFLGGRWLTGYEVIVTQGGFKTGAATLGTVQDPAHPVMSGVATFTGGSSSWRPQNTTLTAGGSVVASWSDGKILVAQGAQPNRVDLGFVPMSSTASSTSWNPATNGALLMANALVHVAGASSANVFCSGDGTGTACPCGNSGSSGNGCASSVSPDGAHISSSGIASLSNDTLVLHGSAMPNSSALYFQGTAQTAGGNGVLFGDGLRCVSGSIVRLKTVVNSAGASHYPQAGDPAVSVRGLIAAPGTRNYQIWYRNAAAFCTPSTFNLTNGVQVDWTS